MKKNKAEQRDSSLKYTQLWRVTTDQSESTHDKNTKNVKLWSIYTKSEDCFFFFFIFKFIVSFRHAAIHKRESKGCYLNKTFYLVKIHSSVLLDYILDYIRFVYLNHFYTKWLNSQIIILTMFLHIFTLWPLFCLVILIYFKENWGNLKQFH